jgi:hypothetical protein
MNRVQQSGRPASVCISLYMLAGLVLASGLWTSGAAAKDYTRSCTAKYIVSPHSFRGESLERTFQGKGTVGSYMPNTARERARRNLDECITAHWNNRYSGARPRECTEANQIYNYPFNSLHTEIALGICQANRGHGEIGVDINVLYSGDTGCLLDRNLWKREIIRDYRVTCAAMAFERDTDRPGMDYRSIELPSSDWHLCQAECDADARCRAWTFVKPGHQGRNARCWLKTGVPEPRPGDCCVSGVKTELR